MFIRKTSYCLLAIFLCLVSIGFAEKEHTDEEIVRAIWFAEGSNQATFAYGIRSVKYSTIAEARRICLRTIRNNRKRYADYGYKQYPDFLSFLASHYCPVKGELSKAEKRLNGNWLKNLKYFLNKGKGVKKYVQR